MIFMVKSFGIFYRKQEKVSNIDKIKKKKAFIAHRYFLKLLDMGISN